MKTYRLTITCKNSETTDRIEHDVVDYYFCDMTHWSSGFDGAYEDTSDLCTIGRHLELDDTEFHEHIVVDFDHTSIDLASVKQYFYGIVDNDNVLSVSIVRL